MWDVCLLAADLAAQPGVGLMDAQRLIFASKGSEGKGRWSRPARQQAQQQDGEREMRDERWQKGYDRREMTEER